MKASNAISVGFGTDVGRAREGNEDAYYVAPPTLPADLRARKGELYIVADGMGGHKGGARASQLAVTLIPQEYYKDPNPNVEQSLNKALQHVNRLIYQEAQTVPDHAHMGTTVVAAVIRGADLVVANVGDSRAYLLRNGEIQQVTRDHSLVSESLASGLITEQEARRHPLRSTITRALGAAPEVKIDFFRLRLQPKDRILLCTDGLSNEVPNAELQAMASRAKPQEAVDKMIQAANERGGRDNITAVLLEVRRLEGVVRPAKPARRASKAVLAALGGVLALLLAVGGIWTFLKVRPASTPLPQVSPVVVLGTSVASPSAYTFAPAPSPTPKAVNPTSTPTLSVNPGLIAPVPPTDTPTPTLTPTATPTPVPKATPTPTPTLVPAPQLEEPAPNSTYTGDRVRVTLKWKEVLGWSGGYQVTVWKVAEGVELEIDVRYEMGTEHQVTLFQPALYCWKVVAAVKKEGEENGIPVGKESEKRCFYLTPRLPTPTPTSTKTPTPTPTSTPKKPTPTPTSTPKTPTSTPNSTPNPTPTETPNPTPTSTPNPTPTLRMMSGEVLALAFGLKRIQMPGGGEGVRTAFPSENSHLD